MVIDLCSELLWILSAVVIWLNYCMNSDVYLTVCKKDCNVADFYVGYLQYKGTNNQNSQLCVASLF